MKIGIIGLGYVGLPLAVEFGKIHTVIGFDINQRRVKELRAGNDSTREVSREELETAKYLSFTIDTGDLNDCNCYIVTVPTPIDEYNRPDLQPLIRASETVGQSLIHI